MPKIYPSLYVTTTGESQSKFDLGKSLTHFESLNTGSYTQVPTPKSHLFWLKKLYAFYQDPKNREVDLETGIKQVIQPQIMHLSTSYARIQNLYLNIKSTNDPVLKKLAYDRNCFHKSMLDLSRKMPGELIMMIKTTGCDEEVSTEEAATVNRSTMMP